VHVCFVALLGVRPSVRASVQINRGRASWMSLIHGKKTRRDDAADATSAAAAAAATERR